MTPHPYNRIAVFASKKAESNFISPAVIAKEPSGSDVQAASDFHDTDQRGVADSPLDFTQISGVQSR